MTPELRQIIEPVKPEPRPCSCSWDYGFQTGKRLGLRQAEKRLERAAQEGQIVVSTREGRQA